MEGIVYHLEATNTVATYKHRYDSGYKHCSNVQALNDFKVDSWDKITKQHFHTASWNEINRPKAIQNEMISYCAEAQIQEILQEIRADEVNECSSREQMSLILSKVDYGGELQEKLIKSMQCATRLIGNTSRDMIFNFIL